MEKVVHLSVSGFSGVQWRPDWMVSYVNSLWAPGKIDPTLLKALPEARSRRYVL